MDYSYGADELTKTTREFDAAGNVTSQETLLFGHDAHGSVRLLTALAGAIEQLFLYDAYGEAVAFFNIEANALTQASLESTKTNYLHDGEFRDSHINAKYLRARWQQDGRFTSLDPYSGDVYNPLSFHKYGFVHGDPINGTDPTGLYTLADSLSATAIAKMLVRLDVNAANTIGQHLGADITIATDPAGLVFGFLQQPLIDFLSQPTGIHFIDDLRSDVNVAMAPLLNSFREWAAANPLMAHFGGAALEEFGGAALKTGLKSIAAGFAVASDSLFARISRRTAGVGNLVDDALASPKFAYELNVLGCFSRDTLVATPSGPRVISELQPGDDVYTFDHKLSQWTVDRVVERFDGTYDGPLYTLSTPAGELTTTAMHPFWVIAGQELLDRPICEKLEEKEDEGPHLAGRWVYAQHLRPGDVVLTLHGQTALLAVSEQLWPSFPICNLSIAAGHTFAVGKDGVLVHNSGPCSFGFGATPSALTNAAKDALRASARDIWQAWTGRRAIWDGMDVHHRIPLEWSHLFPNADPNRVANLIGIRSTDHTLVTNAWNLWRDGLNSRMPTQAEVVQQALRIDDQFGNLMTFLP